jgi:hypothetical protein
MVNFKNAIFIATPGNHDLDCDTGLPVVWANIGTGRQGFFFNLDALGRKMAAQMVASNFSKADK